MFFSEDGLFFLFFLRGNLVRSSVSICSCVQIFVHASYIYMASLLTLMETRMWEAGQHACYDPVLLFFKWRKDGILIPHLILSVLVIIFYLSGSQSVRWNWFHWASVLAHTFPTKDQKVWLGCHLLSLIWNLLCSRR